MLHTMQNVMSESAAFFGEEYCIIVIVSDYLPKIDYDYDYFKNRIVDYDYGVTMTICAQIVDYRL